MSVLLAIPAAMAKRDTNVMNYGYGYGGWKLITSAASTIPGHAECCGRPSAYASACSCLGVRHSTVTTPAKTTIRMATVTTATNLTATALRTTAVIGPTRVQTVTDSSTVDSIKTITLTVASMTTLIVTGTSTLPVTPTRCTTTDVTKPHCHRYDNCIHHSDSVSYRQCQRPIFRLVPCQRSRHGLWLPLLDSGREQSVKLVS